MAHSHHQFSIPQFNALLRKLDYEADYAAAFGDGAAKWLRRRFWFGRLLIFRARKVRET
jgi:hypothetical protein